MEAMCFLFESLNDVERNYDVHDKGDDGDYQSTGSLETPPRRSETTDWRYGQINRNLQYFMSSKKLNRRQARWALYLSRFDFEND